MLSKPLGNALDDDSIGNEVAPLHILLSFLTDIRSSVDCRPQHVSGGDYGNTEALRNPFRLGALADSGRAEEDKPHLGYLLYPRIIRFASIWRMRSITTETLMSSEV